MKRRDAFKAAAVAAGLFGVPNPPDARAAALPADTLFSKDPEAWWKIIRDDQFLLPGWRCFMNNGSLGVAPRPVVEAVTKYLERAAALLVDGYPRWGYETLDEERSQYADFFGCKKDELAFVHNATEAMSIIAAGLDLKAGDEVLMTDQEHGSGKNPWFLRRARHGITVREVPLPLPPKSQEQLTDVLISALGQRTRVLSFSGITTTTGLVLPVREICTAAREKGVITVVDAAHMHGQTHIRMSDFNCDFLAGSPHKWVYAPAGCGVLYIREEMLDRLWPTIVTGGWDDPKLKAARFMRVGTNNRAIFTGMMAGLEFLKQLKAERVYSRIHQLARMAFDRAHGDGLHLLTPDDDRMFAGLVTFDLDKEHARRFLDLCEKRRIWSTGSARMRVSTHIHTRPQDIELFFETLREARA